MHRCSCNQFVIDTLNKMFGKDDDLDDVQVNNGWSRMGHRSSFGDCRRASDKTAALKLQDRTMRDCMTKADDITRVDISRLDMTDRTMADRTKLPSPRSFWPRMKTVDSTFSSRPSLSSPAFVRSCDVSNLPATVNSSSSTFRPSVIAHSMYIILSVE